MALVDLGQSRSHASRRPQRSFGSFGSFAAIACAAAEIAPRTTAAWLARRFLTPSRAKVRSEEEAVLGEAVKARVRIGASRVRTYRWGESGPVVLLAHGWGGRAGQLTALVEPLRRRGFVVLAFDAPAHGASSGTRTNVAEMADAMIAVASSVGGVDAVVAHSIGAAVLALAATRGLVVDRAALIAPSPGPRRFAEHFVDAVALRLTARAHFFATIEDIAGAPFSALEIETTGASLACPIFVAQDDDDPVVSRTDARRVTAALGATRALRTRDLGHFRILRDARVIDAVTSFLGEAQKSLADRVPSSARFEQTLRDPNLQRIVEQIAFQMC